MPVKKFELVIVDDDAAIARLVERILAQQLSDLFNFVAFTDPRAAREWLGCHACDVLISDVEMPGIGGFDLLRTGKLHHCRMQTIFLTAHSSWDRIAEAIEHGVNDYLLKPVDHAELVGLLLQKHECLSRSGSAIDSVNGKSQHAMPAAPVV